jgi:hypothetical protein
MVLVKGEPIAPPSKTETPGEFSFNIALILPLIAVAVVAVAVIAVVLLKKKK